MVSSSSLDLDALSFALTIFETDGQVVNSAMERLLRYRNEDGIPLVSI